MLYIKCSDLNNQQNNNQQNNNSNSKPYFHNIISKILQKPQNKNLNLMDFLIPVENDNLGENNQSNYLDDDEKQRQKVIDQSKIASKYPEDDDGELQKAIVASLREYNQKQNNQQDNQKDNQPKNQTDGDSINSSDIESDDEDNDLKIIIKQNLHKNQKQNQQKSEQQLQQTADQSNLTNLIKETNQLIKNRQTIQTTYNQQIGPLNHTITKNLESIKQLKEQGSTTNDCKTPQEPDSTTKDLDLISSSLNSALSASEKQAFKNGKKRDLMNMPKPKLIQMFLQYQKNNKKLQKQIENLKTQLDHNQNQTSEILNKKIKLN